MFVCFSDREYPRLGQMIVDYENPLKKMMEEFVPHGKVLHPSLMWYNTVTNNISREWFWYVHVLYIIMNVIPVFILMWHSLPVFSLTLQSLSDALISLQMVYPRRNLSADQWRNAQLLSLISAPSTMLNPAQSDTVNTQTIQDLVCENVFSGQLLRL